MALSWVPLESNPEVITNFLIKLGVPANVQAVDVFSLDKEMLDFIPQPVAALMLLFPCDDEYEAHRLKQDEEIKSAGQTVSDKLFFLKQFVHNACGTIALIHGVANTKNITLEGGILKEYLDKARPLDPTGRGELLQESQGIIDSHKEVALEGQTAPPDDREPVPYHFVAFVEFDGTLYELDGRKSFPINHGASSPNTFLYDAAKVCQDYIKRNPNNVMTKFLIKLGVPASVQVVDVFSLEPDMLPFVPQPVAALILLFPSTSESKDLRARQEAEITAKGQQIYENIFFMKQIVRNACGSIALIHSIANAANITLEDGHLKEYIEKGRSLDPVSRGELLEKSQGIIDCHKEIANEGQTAPPSETANVPYHFISFVEKDGSLYELDGGRPFPINHGPSSPESFLEDAAAACREYVTSNPDNLHFSVCAITY